MTIVLLDDRLLVEELLVGLPAADGVRLATTSTWWYRACRAAVVAGGGHLSGPFSAVRADLQELAVLALLELREDIELPDARSVVPAMARLARDHPKLNLLNLDAAASASILDADVWLSPQAARGILPPVLDDLTIWWRVVEV
jgi:hypothetical protein